MNFSFVQLILGLALGTSAHASGGIPCRQAIDEALKKYSSHLSYQSVKSTPIGNEGLVELTAIAYGWTPKSDAASGYYYLASATCRQEQSGLVLWNTLLPAEGGVTVKIINKQRY